MNPSRNVASEGSSRPGGAPGREHMNEYVSVPSTAGTRNTERSSFGTGS